MDLVRKGIFRYTPNAIYIFALAAVWIPAMVFFSNAALIAAFFNHIYIWVHYFTVEIPDMRQIYKDNKYLYNFYQLLSFPLLIDIKPQN